MLQRLEGGASEGHNLIIGSTCEARPHHNLHAKDMSNAVAGKSVDQAKKLAVQASRFKSKSG